MLAGQVGRQLKLGCEWDVRCEVRAQKQRHFVKRTVRGSSLLYESLRRMPELYPQSEQKRNVCVRLDKWGKRCKQR
jgi:hypothetical protein